MVNRPPGLEAGEVAGRTGRSPRQPAGMGSGVPGFPVVSLQEEGEHPECSPPARRMAELCWAFLPNFAKASSLPA